MVTKIQNRSIARFGISPLKIARRSGCIAHFALVQPWPNGAHILKLSAVLVTSEIQAMAYAFGITPYVSWRHFRLMHTGPAHRKLTSATWQTPHWCQDP